MVTNPSAMVIGTGESEAVVVELVDEAGDPFSTADVTVTSSGSGISVERNPNFLGTTTGSPLQTRAQFIVTAGEALVTTSFTLSSGDLSVEVPVRVISSGPIAGTEAPETAPVLEVPAAGATTTLFDFPDFVTAPFRYYRLDVTEAGSYTITTNWTVGTDVDMYVCSDPVDTVGFSNCEFAGATTAHPETAAYDLAAGTYFVVLNDYGHDASGTTVSIDVSR